MESGTQKQQREYFLRRQMDAIRKELGENESSVIEEYRKKIDAAQMPEAVHKQAHRELARLEKMGESNAEASMIRTYLDWLLAVPWSKRSEERLDPKYAREVLDADHAGLDDVKRRITEYLAVRKLRTERGLADTRRSGAILTLIGPPGTGKTSIGESIARATGRKFVRMSLGGVRDEAEIRGHRRTYIGALPGRLVRALRDAGTMNPVIMLDEVDKLGADWRGDPSSALLEVLDPAQNHAFQDHYLDVELDLSHVLFIATANVAETIPGRCWTAWKSSGSMATPRTKKSPSRADILAAADRTERIAGRRSHDRRRCACGSSSPTTPVRPASASSNASSARCCVRRQLPSLRAIKQPPVAIGRCNFTRCAGPAEGSARGGSRDRDPGRGNRSGRNGNRRRRALRRSRIDAW